MPRSNVQKEGFPISAQRSYHSFKATSLTTSLYGMKSDDVQPGVHEILTKLCSRLGDGVNNEVVIGKALSLLQHVLELEEKGYQLMAKRHKGGEVLHLQLRR